MTSEYQQAKLLVELAAIAAYHGEAFLRTTSSVSNAGVEAYWIASRSRLENWSHALKDLEERSATDSSPCSVEVEEQWAQTRPLAEEILASEVLTRIWTAIGCEFDRRHDSGDVEPFVRSILVSHLDARHRLLRLVFNRLQLRPGSLRSIDRMRRGAERWTDVLLGYLISCCRVGEFAFDASRVEDFATSLNNQYTSPEAVKSLLMVSLRSTFKTGFSMDCPNAFMNSQICESVLACYGNDLFESTGQFRSLWQVRLAHAAKDTMGMIDCLASEHDGFGSFHPYAGKHSSRE